MKKKKINIRIDKELMIEYGKHYLKLHPRSRNHPLSKFSAKDKTVGSVFPPSLNEMTNNPNRLAQNGKKEKWKEFVLWLSKKHGICDWNLERAKVTYKWTFGDKRRRDLDNAVMHVKFINDGLTEAKVWQDDCFGKIRLYLDTEWYVEKDCPSLDIKIEEI